jgi:hypothetical protein
MRYKHFEALYYLCILLVALAFLFGYGFRYLQTADMLCIETEPLDIGGTMQSESQLIGDTTAIRGSLEITNGEPCFTPDEPIIQMSGLGPVKVYEPIEMCGNHWPTITHPPAEPLEVTP